MPALTLESRFRTTPDAGSRYRRIQPCPRLGRQRDLRSLIAGLTATRAVDAGAVINSAIAA
jgi:hypothetical protein